MARGSDNQPSDKHWGPGTKCEIVVYEQGKKHRDASRATSDGYAKGRGGARSWQSHHLVCISAMGDRKAKDDATSELLETSLYITKWNINEDPNMIGLPMWRLYAKKYGNVALRAKKDQAAAYARLVPKNLPAHDVDHNTEDGFTDEVKVYLKQNVWNKFNSEEGDHKKDAEWLAKKLKNASGTFKGWLTGRGIRKGGTVPAWKKRFDDTRWAAPFSMAKRPTTRNAGKSFRDLADIFEQL